MPSLFNELSRLGKHLHGYRGATPASNTGCDGRRHCLRVGAFFFFFPKFVPTRCQLGPIRSDSGRIASARWNQPIQAISTNSGRYWPIQSNIGRFRRIPALNQAEIQLRIINKKKKCKNIFKPKKKKKNLNPSLPPASLLSALCLSPYILISMF